MISLVNISSKVVEDAFASLLLDNIAATEDFKDFNDQAQEVRVKRDRQRLGIAANIAEVEAKIALENAKMNAAKGHENLQAMVTESVNEIARQMARKIDLEKKLENVPTDDMRLLALTELLQTLRDRTKAFDFAALQELTILTVKDALLMTLTRHFILLRIEWEHLWPTQDVVIYRKLSGRDDPDPAEMEFLKANFMTMEVNELLEGVPGMSLDSIMITMKKEGLRRKHVPGALYKSHVAWRRYPADGLKYDPRFSVEDHQVMEQYGIELKDVQAIKERAAWKIQEFEVMAVSYAPNAVMSAQIA